MSSEESEDAYMDSTDCKNETGASDKDLEEIINRTGPTTKTAKCFTACHLNKLGVVSSITV